MPGLMTADMMERLLQQQLERQEQQRREQQRRLALSQGNVGRPGFTVTETPLSPELQRQEALRRMDEMKRNQHAEAMMGALSAGPEAGVPWKQRLADTPIRPSQGARITGMTPLELDPTLATRAGLSAAQPAAAPSAPAAPQTFTPPPGFGELVTAPRQQLPDYLGTAGAQFDPFG